jgi:EAL domain-containing protein (putative c-di-GMP-specific phosphodiesterase class I)
MSFANLAHASMPVSNPMLDSVMTLESIMTQRALRVVFQPILDMGKAQIFGYEALIRGPEKSDLEAPDALFAHAMEIGRYDDLNFLAASLAVERFVALRLPGKLFLNMSPAALTSRNDEASASFFRGIGLNARRIVIELTEQVQAIDPELLKRNIKFYRRLGFQVALDDLGQGHSSLGLWMDLQPEFVKADKHFVQGAHLSDRQRYFLEGIQGLARASGAQVIAEGIEIPEEFLLAQTLAIGFGQGYYISKPSSYPPVSLPKLLQQTIVAEPSAPLMACSAHPDVV